jgi:hypothetical protein
MIYKSVLSVSHAPNTFELSFICFELFAIFIGLLAKFKEVEFKMLERLLHYIEIVAEHQNYLCLGSFFL